MSWSDGCVTRSEYKKPKPEKSPKYKCSGCRAKVQQVFRIGDKAYCSANCFMIHNPMELTGDETRLDAIAQELKESRNSGRKVKR